MWSGTHYTSPACHVYVFWIHSYVARLTLMAVEPPGLWESGNAKCIEPERAIQLPRELFGPAIRDYKGLLLLTAGLLV